MGEARQATIKTLHPVRRGPNQFGPKTTSGKCLSWTQPSARPKSPSFSTICGFVWVCVHKRMGLHILVIWAWLPLWATPVAGQGQLLNPTPIPYCPLPDAASQVPTF